MKKSLLALAALTAFAGVASAQSSVTLFGVVDLAATKSMPIRERSLMTTDGNSSSRLGFRGVEDLGGGLKAGFWLEGALSRWARLVDDYYWSCNHARGGRPDLAAPFDAQPDGWFR
jgi:predicted porin